MHGLHAQIPGRTYSAAEALGEFCRCSLGKAKAQRRSGGARAAAHCALCQDSRLAGAWARDHDDSIAVRFDSRTLVRIQRLLGAGDSRVIRRCPFHLRVRSLVVQVLKGPLNARLTVSAKSAQA